MNINSAINGVIDRLLGGEKVRIKLGYKDEILSRLQNNYSNYKFNIIEENDDYFFLQRERSKMSFSPEDIAACIHDTNGNVVVPSTELDITGFDSHGRSVSDITSVQCLARRVIDPANPQSCEFFIASNRSGGLYNPFGATDYRAGWIKCTRDQFDRYLACLRSGQQFDMRALKDELQLM